MKNTLKREKLSFSNLEIEGFCRVGGTLAYKLSSPGITVIRGKNGVGKTTLFSALVWVLYGATLKNSKSPETWEDLKPTGYMGTKVTVTFRVGETRYSVTRCHKYKGLVEGSKGDSRLVIIREGEMLSGFKDKPEVQAYLEDLIGYPQNLFRNTVIFGQKLTRLIGQSGPAKKKLLEEAFEVSWVEEAKSLAVKSLSEAKQDLALAKNNKTNLETTIQEKQQKLEEYVRQSEKKDSETENSPLQELKSNLLTLNQEIEALTEGAPRESLERASQVYKSKEKQVAEASSEISKLKHSKLHNLEKEIVKASSVGDSVISRLKEEIELLRAKKITPVCSSCNNPLTKAQVEKITQDKATLLGIKEDAYKHQRLTLANTLESLSAKKKGIEGEIVDWERTLRTFSGERDKALEYVNKHKQQVTQLTQKESSVISLKAQIRTLESYTAVNFYKPLIMGLKKEIAELENSLLGMEKSLKKLENKTEAFQWVVNEPLSNKGIKAFVFSTMMRSINQELLKYSSTLGFRVHFDIDLVSVKKDFETKVYQGTQEREYEDLSGGQQQLVDCAIAFAMHDTMNVTKPVNLLFLDEIFESLDEQNIERVVDLIRVKAQGRVCCHVVTHRKDFTVSNATEVLIVESKGSIEVLR